MTELESALFAIPPDDRDTWLRAGMAIKAELGDSGWQIWNEWSAGWDRYKERECRTAWKSFKPGAGVTIATLYYIAKEHGWQGTGEPTKVDPERARLAREEAERCRKEEYRRSRAVAAQAETMMYACRVGWSGYLARKKFPKEEALLFTGGVRFEGQYGPYIRQYENALYLPIRDFQTGKIMTAEIITDDGQKLFLPGGKRRGGAVRISVAPRVVLCEGYATGLSVAAAFKKMGIRVGVTAVMAANNLPVVAEIAMPWLVVADADESGTGLKYAQQTGARVWSPPDDKDANDLHCRAGLDALVSELRAACCGVA